MNVFHGCRALTAFLVVLASANVVDAFSLGTSPSPVLRKQHNNYGWASSFVPSSSTKQRSNRATRKATSFSSNTHLSMVVDRLSDTCVEATKAAMTLGHKIGVSQVRNELLLAGIVAHPERARRTLEEFGINAFEVDMAARQVLREKQISTGVASSNDEEALPFGDDAKATLSRACEIADDMESSTVRSEHVLLALFGYNNGQVITNIPVGDTLKAVPTIKKKRQFSVTVFCNELVQTLPLLATNEEVSANRVVVSRGDTGTGSTLQEVGVDWTQLALEGKLDPVYGREKEIRSALRTLGRRRKNNPVLLGDPGVGKTAVAEGVALVLAEGLRAIQASQQGPKPLSRLGKMMEGPNQQQQEVPPSDLTPSEEAAAKATAAALAQLPPCPPTLVGTRLINVELASLVAGTGSRGSLEEKVKKLIKEATESNVILFIDELHNLIGEGGGGEGSLNAANLLKPALARGELRVLGATTTPEYRRYIEADGALERRFQPLNVKEPTVYETLDILAAVSPKYEAFHGVKYTYDALVAAAKLSDRYLPDRFLPDKAVDLIDEAGSKIKMNEEGDNFQVTEDDIADIISEMTGIPLGRLDRGEKSRLKSLEAALSARVKGQPAAIRSVAKSIRRARSGMRDGRRPVASFLFCGSTGVGKTELCKALADTYYGQEKDMIRIDMSEYMDRFSTSRLIGAPPGYVGYEQGGQLTEAVRRSPHSVILFDEVEKAHEDVLNLLLQVMDDGQLTDGKGRTVSFRNNILVMTSNLGSKELLDAAKNEGVDVSSEDVTADKVKAALEEAMKPEFLNRIDEIVVFSPLSYEILKEISSYLIEETVKRVKEDQNIQLAVHENIVEIVTREGYSVGSMYGARPIRRAVQRFLEDTLAEAIMDGFIDEGDSVSVNLHDPNGESQSVVKITRTIDGESVLIDVDADAGIGSDIWADAAFGDFPSLDDTGPPKRDPGAFQ